MVELDYNKSLWLMLEKDKKNRKRILNFLNIFPRKLYNNLLNDVKELKGNEKGIKSGQIVINDIIYYYELIPRDKSILLSRYFKKDTEKNDIFVLKLYPYKEKVELNKSIDVGEIIYQVKGLDGGYIYDCDEVKYSIEKKISGIYFVKTCNYNLFFNKFRWRIFIEEIPSFLDIKSFNIGKNRVKKRQKFRSY